jgi:hypothetical protein
MLLTPKYATPTHVPALQLRTKPSHVKKLRELAGQLLQLFGHNAFMGTLFESMVSQRPWAALDRQSGSYAKSLQLFNCI